MSAFEAWPKIPRWNREVVITEKIDGTNAAIIIELVADWAVAKGDMIAAVQTDGGNFGVWAQSRTRLIRPGADNFGFAAWVKENAAALVELLGPGRHFGEWFGSGIQRNYGLDHKRFALFNTGRWSPEDTIGYGLAVDVVPVLARLDTPFESRFGGYGVDDVLDDLRKNGSLAVPGFMRPEGIVLWHTAARQSFKILLEGDDAPKGSAA